MSSRSLTSWPTRCIGWAQSATGQLMFSGSWWCSMRSRCAGRACRLGWRFGSAGAAVGAVGAVADVAAWACSASSWACRLASSAASVSSNNWRCSAFMDSLRAANFHALSRASSNVMRRVLASLNLMARSRWAICWLCAAMRWLCDLICSSICAATPASAAGLRPCGSWALNCEASNACAWSMVALCKLGIGAVIRADSDCLAPCQLRRNCSHWNLRITCV